MAKNLLKSLFWALSLGQSKLSVHPLVANRCVSMAADPLVLSGENAKMLAKVGEQYI